MGLNVLRQVLGVAVVVVLTRTLTKEQFGNYQGVLAVVGLCSAFTLTGLGSVIVQSVARGHEGTYRAAVRMSFLGAIFGGLVILGCGIGSWMQGDRDSGYAYLIAGILFPFSQGLLNWQSYQAGKEQFRVTALHQGLSMLIAYGVIIASVFILKPNIIAPVAIYFGVYAVQNVRMVQRIQGQIPADAETEPGSMRYGLRISFYELFNTVGNYLDRLLLLYCLSPEALAVYAASSRIPELLKVNIQAARQVLIPELARQAHYTRSLDKKLNLVGLVTLLGLGLIGIGIVPWFLPLVFSDKYADAVIYCQLLLLSVGIGTFATTKYTYILSQLDERTIRGVNISANVVRIASAAVLVPWLGIIGAVISTILYRIANASVIHYYIRKYHRFP